MTCEENPNLIFVYGTLRRDFANESSNILAREGSFAGEGLVRGCLFRLGSYAGLVLSEDPNEFVRGDLFDIPLDRHLVVLDQLDRYENCAPSDPRPHQYKRGLVDVFTNTGATVTAWAYLLNRPIGDLEPIESGDYLAWRAAREEALYVEAPDS